MIIGARIEPRFLCRLLAAAAYVMTAGCSKEVGEFMREPKLSPVGSGLVREDEMRAESFAAPGYPGVTKSPFVSPSNNLYTDRRITKVGDIVTVMISINDKATFGNSTDRSKTTKNNFSADWNFVNNMGASAAGAGASPQPSTITGDLTSTSSTQGQGNIDRQEQIQVSVAAIVTEVLPNGNLVVSGSQEVRVNYELRQLSVAGIIRPSDISRNNTITYDRIAEARISYGGRGRLNDVQQPSWGQQLYDFFKPF